jgi:hypothetical protein
MLRIRDVYPGSGSHHFRHPGSGSRILVIFRIRDLGSGKNIIPDPDPGSGSRILGVKKHRIPDPDPQHWSLLCLDPKPKPIFVRIRAQQIRSDILFDPDMDNII